MMQDHPYLTSPRLIAWIALFVLFTLLMMADRRAEPIYSDAVLVYQWNIPESLVS